MNNASKYRLHTSPSRSNRGFKFELDQGRTFDVYPTSCFNSDTTVETTEWTLTYSTGNIWPSDFRLGDSYLS